MLQETGGLRPTQTGFGTTQLGQVVGKEEQLGHRVACSPEGLKENSVHLFTFSDVSKHQNFD